MITQILYQEQAKTTMAKGIETIANIVSATLGPSGCNTILYKNSNTPQILNNGCTIIKEIELEDPFENTGIKLIRQAASKTYDIVKDGTTRTILIAHSLIHYGMNYIDIGINTADLIMGMEKAIEFLSDKITEYAQPVKDTTTLRQIATVASGNNQKIGATIAKVVEEIGLEGFISLEENPATNTTIEITKGIKLDKGLISNSFIKEGKTRIVQDDPYILITDKKINLVQEELIPVLELVGKTDRPLLILAEDFSTEVISTLAINYIKGIMNVAAIRIPGFGNQRRPILEDICSITNGKIISEEVGIKLDSIKLSMLGEADKTFIDSNNTTIILKDKKHLINKRCNQLRKQINISNTIYERENLQNRLARISGKTATIKIGASTNTELQNKKASFREGLGSVYAAVEEGIIPGGESISIHLAFELLAWAQQSLSGDELKGALLVKKSLVTPLQMIIQNAGYNHSIILEKLKNSNLSIGYNTEEGQFVNMYKEGIIDSAKIMRLILQNAASIAKMFLTTECIIVNKTKNC